MKLVALQGVDERRARAAVPGLEIVKTDSAGLLDVVAGADAIVGRPPQDKLAEVLRLAPDLKWIHVSSAGVDNMLCPELAASRVTLTCGKGRVVGPLLAEHAFGLMMALARGIVLSIKQGNWQRPSAAGKMAFEVAGKTLGIVGYGGVGEELAKRAKAFGMEVIAVRRTVTGDEAPATVWPTERFHDMLAASHVVVVTVPDTPDTRGMFDDTAFSKMRRGAFLVTVGRGRTVDTDALVRALSSGHLGGAGLDVVDPEPLPDDHPLWSFDNVVITSHIAGNSPERAGRNMDLVLENLTRLSKGEPLVSAVDHSAGY